jgi:hypothetical protein
MAKIYESDITRFLRELKAARPELDQQQREGRARLWDRSLDAEQQARWQEARIAQKPYVYQSEAR